MNRLYSNYVPPKLTKLALGGHESFYPQGTSQQAKQQQQQYAATERSKNLRNIVKPVVNNPVIKEVIDPKYDIPVAAMQAGATSATLVPGTQAVTLPVAAGVNAFGVVRGGLQMANSWANGTYDSDENPGANTQLATDTASNLLNFVPGSKILRPLAKNLDATPNALNVAGEMLKRPPQMSTSVVGSQIAGNQNSSQQQPTQAPVVQQNTKTPTASNTQATQQNIKTNSYRPKYSPPKLNKLAAKEEYLTQADYDPGFTLMQPGDNYKDFIRNNVKAQLEMGRRRGAFAGTILGALGGGLAGHKLLEDNETLGKYSPYAAGVAGALLGAGIGNLAGRPIGMLSSVPDIPYTVVQSMPIMQDAYRKLTQPVFPDYVDPNTYI